MGKVSFQHELGAYGPSGWPVLRVGSDRHGLDNRSPLALVNMIGYAAPPCFVEPR